MDKDITYEEEIDSGIEDKIKKIKKQLKRCQKEKEEYLVGWQRAKADFINYRRRQEEHNINLKKNIQEELIYNLLSLLDGLNAAAQIKEGDAENLKKGIYQLNQQLVSTLQTYGLKEIPAQGENFDPQLHEAIEQVESDQPGGQIVEEVQKGYFLNDKVLRYSKVKVAK